jgi:hypothetical protein
LEVVFCSIKVVVYGYKLPKKSSCLFNEIRALSAHSAAEFNISPGRWQHLWLVAIVPPKRWGKIDRNDCHTAWGNFKTLISSLYHNKNYFGFFKKELLLFLSFLPSIAIYRLQVTTFLTLARVAIEVSRFYQNVIALQNSVICQFPDT